MFKILNEAKKKVMVACGHIAVQSELAFREKNGGNCTVDMPDGKSIPLHEYQKLKHNKFVTDLYNDTETRCKLYILYMFHKINPRNTDLKKLFGD